MVNRKILLGVTVIAMLTLSVGVAWADEVTSEINYQGRLAGSSGSPLTGTYTMTFRLYETATGGTALDMDAHQVEVTDGLFNTHIGFDQSYFDGRALWLGIKVGTDSEMTPRQEFRPVPYALSLVPGARIMGAAQWNLNVETTHASGRALRGQASSTSGTNYGVVGASKSPDGYGGYFYNNEGGVGVYGKGEYGGYFDGNVRINQPEPTIVLHDTDGGGTKARIVFENTDRLVIQGEDDADEKLGVYSTFSKNRDHDAHIQVFGSATNTWGNYIEITHDGTDGIIGTDVGDILLNPAGNVGIGMTSPEAKLDVRGDVRIRDSADSKSIRLRTTGGALDLDYFGADSMYFSGWASGEQKVMMRMDRGSGKVGVNVLEIWGGSDLSEKFEIRGSGEDLLPAPGMVVSIDPESPGDLMVSTKAYDRRVAGIISGAGGVKPGMLMGQEDSEADGTTPVALTGRVYCRADASKGPIEPGDLLTTSDTPGHAMKVADYTKAQGAILGKAMSPLDEGQGLVLVLVTLQ
jgi:hypothetical protein